MYPDVSAFSSMAPGRRPPRNRWLTVLTRHGEPPARSPCRESRSWTVPSKPLRKACPMAQSVRYDRSKVMRKAADSARRAGGHHRALPDQEQGSRCPRPKASPGRADVMTGSRGSTPRLCRSSPHPVKALPACGEGTGRPSGGVHAMELPINQVVRKLSIALAADARSS